MDTSALSQTELDLVTTATSIIDAITRPIPFETHISSVSCAALSSAGRIFTGVNFTHFTGGPCAEHVALGNANAAGIMNRATEGEVLTLIVAVFDRGRGVVNPCGKCRQILLDYHAGIRVVVNEGGVYRCVGIRELLPYAFEHVVRRRAASDK
ncbi:blasticidin S deaminase [Calycina marina]|uniref:Blasticidin S deaminase n=1 Tax=Calycina marina TaxID=1763456 RepID=A0A9P8CFP8_9HELO|nr:blasticidin S deaminase [Calycina marina]